MKTNGTLTIFLKSILCILFINASISASAQPDYVFKNAVLQSGTDLQAGAVYRFSNVRPGTDALVTITDIFKVGLNQLDGPSGFDEAFQPYIQCPAHTKGYVEFRFDFVKAGTATPKVMTEVPVTAIDIDGYEFPDEKIYESDEFSTTSAYYVDYDLLGSSLNVTYSPGWVKANNVTAINYPGIDTVQKDVMISMVYANVSSITFRVGADNRSKTSQERLRSDYFKKFMFPSSMLATSSLVKFSGFSKNNSIELQWELASKNHISKVVIEKSVATNHFQSIGEQSVNFTINNYLYTDAGINDVVAYYRLKLVSENGSISYSKILAFHADDKKEPFKLYPSIINDNATVSISSDKNEQSSLRVVDLGGRIVYQKTLALHPGNNNVSVNDLGRIHQGTYVALVTSGNSTYSQKIIIQ